MVLPTPSMPMTMMTRCASSGITGSWEACALSGRRLAPSASTSTKSASCASVPIESHGAQSLPLSACEATQTMPDRSNAAETAARPHPAAFHTAPGGRCAFVVVIMTFPFFESSPGERFHQRRLSAAADDGRHAAANVQKRCDLHIILLP